jgi:uncharacterized protein YndB with AHSA1/START domain/uncharacterized protein YciI
MTAEPAASAPQGGVSPIRREVRVGCDPETAFELFTAHLAAWWPLAEFSVFGGRASVAFEDGRVVERLGARHAVWGTVLEWNRPDGFSMTWHPGKGPERATQIAVSFESDGDGTLVRLTHTGWERLAEPAAAREEYNGGWPHVLEGFGQLVEATSDAGEGPDGQEWFALHHRPGAALADGESIFAHPLFPEHLAFLGRLRERGWLVAAGPVDAAKGEGMAVVKLPAGSGPELEELARSDDASVVGEALAVTVQPWDVRFTGI